MGLLAANTGTHTQAHTLAHTGITSAHGPGYLCPATHAWGHVPRSTHTDAQTCVQPRGARVLCVARVGVKLRSLTVYAGARDHTWAHSAW